METIARKDFAAFSDDELESAKRFIRHMKWRPPVRRSRRRQPDRRGAELDIRRLLRRSLSQGGEIVVLPRRSHQSKPRQLVVLCDVSGSMDSYTRVLMHFLYVLRSCCAGAEIFLFGTRLTRITQVLAREDPDRVLDAIGEESSDWSGGTRIGEALAEFNRIWARRVTAHGAVVMVISDGLDRGEPRRLQQEMARLSRLSHSLIWLNPLLGSPGYAPLTRGMRAALPWIDHFAPVNNLLSLESLVEVLNSLPACRDARRSSRFDVAADFS